MNDIRKVIDSGRMTGLQVLAFLICVLMNMLDGMDVMVIAYAAPALAAEWSVTPGKLGTVFSSGLMGMALGAMFLAPLADRIGRRRMILICILVMGFGTWLTAYAQTVGQLICLRLASGLGIGAMLATSATMTAEYVPHRYRNFAVSAVFAGYPFGAVLSGLVAAWVIPAYGWPSIFFVAGAATLLTIVPVWFLLPESLDFLVKVRPTGALDKMNRILSRMGSPPLTELPASPAGERIKRANVGALFSPRRRMSTTWLWIAFFSSFATLYFLTSWIPKLASNTGLSMELAIYAGTVFNLGSCFGILAQGYMSQRFSIRRVIFAFLLATAVVMISFGFWTDPMVNLLMFGLIGFGMQGGFVGLYAVAASIYPTEIRNTGIGWGIGAGRLGAVAGPKVGGTLVGLGLSMTASFVLFAVPLLVAGVATLFIGNPENE